MYGTPVSVPSAVEVLQWCEPSRAASKPRPKLVLLLLVVVVPLLLLLLCVNGTLCLSASVPSRLFRVRRLSERKILPPIRPNFPPHTYHDFDFYTAVRTELAAHQTRTGRR